jgi:hypothetical protein
VLIQLCVVEDTKKVLKCIVKMFRTLKSDAIPLETLQILLEGLQQALEWATELKGIVLKDYKDAEDCDEDKEAEIKEDYESYNDILQSTPTSLAYLNTFPLVVSMEISGQLIKFYHERVENLIAQTLAPTYYNSLYSTNSSENELLYCLCFFDDLLAFCSQDVPKTPITSSRHRYS